MNDSIGFSRKMDSLDETLSDFMDECLRFEEIHDQEGQNFHECMRFGEAEGAETNQEAKELGVEAEVKDDQGTMRRAKTSHSQLVRNRVPGIRAKGLDDEIPYTVIPGRKGRKGEKVVVLGAGQKWTDQDPPITVHSDIDSESDALFNRGYKKSSNLNQQDVDRPISTSLSPDSEDECHVMHMHGTLGNTRCISGQEKVGQEKVRDGKKTGFSEAHDRAGFFTTTPEKKRDDFYSEVKPLRFKAVKEEVVFYQQKERNVDSSGKTFIRNDFEKPHQGPNRSPMRYMDSIYNTEKGFGDCQRRSFHSDGKRPMPTGSAFVIKTEFDSEDESLNGKRSRYNRQENSFGKRPRLPTQSQPYSKVTEADVNADLTYRSQSYHTFQNGEHDEMDFLSMSPRRRVKGLREMFHERRRIYTKEEDIRIRSRVAGNETHPGAPRLRADLKAYADVDKQLNPRKDGARRDAVSIVGHIPGIEVGDYFFYRIELLLVGLHRQIQGGIDFITASKRKFFDTYGNPMSAAVSVVAAKGGGYQNKHEGNILMYTGQGTNRADQDMVRGNLALKNSCDLGLCVRVVRGIEVLKAEADINLQLECPALSSPSGFIYFYDGLYDVMNYHQEVGPGGFKVWKFKLVRQPGQRPVPEVLMRAV